MSASTRPSRPPLVLIANDHDWSARGLESLLGPRGYAVLRVTAGQRALELARIAQPDALIIDVDLPDLAGKEVCARLRRERLVSSNVPLILTASAIGGRAERIEAYAAGAWELCAEPFDVEILLLKLQAFIEAKLMADRVREETLVDEETGLYNVRGLARRAREIAGEVVRRGEALACVVFSPEPDTHVGEVQSVTDGAEVAEAVSRVCRSKARISDAVGRLGPNEYAIIAPATGESGADRIVERLRDSFAATTVRVRDREHRLRLAATVAVVPNLAESTVDAVELLYTATASLRQTRGYTQPQAAEASAES